MHRLRCSLGRGARIAALVCALLLALAQFVDFASVLSPSEGAPARLSRRVSNGHVDSSADCSVDLAAAFAGLPAGCLSGRDPDNNRSSVEIFASYARWHTGKLAFLRAARGNVSAARELQAAAGDADPPLSLAVYSGRFGGGWGDRLPALVSLFGFALRYRRLFLVDYPELDPWMCSRLVDWHVNNGTLPLLVAQLAKSDPHIRYNCNPPAHCVLSEGHPIDGERASDAAPLVLHYVSNRGIWPHANPDHVRFFSALVNDQPACLHQILMRPTRHLLERVSS